MNVSCRYLISFLGMYIYMEEFIGLFCILNFIVFYVIIEVLYKIKLRNNFE